MYSEAPFPLLASNLAHLDDVHVHAVELQVLGRRQKGALGLRGGNSPEREDGGKKRFDMRRSRPSAGLPFSYLSR